MAKKSIICKNWPKYLLQWGVLAALIFFLSGLGVKLFGLEPSDPEKYCPFGGLQALATYISRASLPCSMSSLQILMGIAVATAVILFSKLFCAFICPIGTIEDLLKKLRSAIKLRAIVIKSGSIADKILRVVKYGLLFWIAYMTMTASELFCKNLDPYYAVATGFKGEITLWMSITTVSIVILLGLFIDRFWCKYICPLGAVSNTLKFWAWVVLLFGIWWALGLLGLNLPWVYLLAAFCLVGYLFEILCRRPKLHILSVVVDQDKCGRTCHSCMKNCPYGIDVPEEGARVNNVDCMLCGECVAACPTKALSIGVCKPHTCKFTKLLPALVAVVLVVAAFLVGRTFELPTISETWGLENVKSELVSVKIGPLKSVKCYSSSMNFKSKMERVPGVHGVKTYVGSHTVEISYDPTVTDEEKINKAVFTPSRTRVNSLESGLYDSLKVVTVRVEHMFDKMDLNYLGLQFRGTNKKIYGIESQYDCPVVVKLYVAPDEVIDEAFVKEVVNRKSLDMETANGIKKTPMSLEFVKLEKEISHIEINQYLRMMFSGYGTTFREKANNLANEPQFIYEIVDKNYEKPVIVNAMPYLASHLSEEEGIIGVALTLNAQMQPCIQIHFASISGEDVWNKITAETWNIHYTSGETKQEAARIKFNTPGVVIAK